jgi:ligand-binding sensor domain-containing protein/serine phosphatase RsbU (regulator of sigma subunit)
MIKVRILSFLLLFCIPIAALAQSYKFRQFSTDDGISQPFIYGVTQDEKGYLWIGTGEGLCQYDGFRFKTYLKEDSLAESFVSATHRDPKGVLWFGHMQGGISFYEDGRLKKLDTRLEINSSINSIATDTRGNTWFATQSEGLARVGPYQRITHYKNKFQDLLLYSLHFTPSDLMLVGTDEGLYLYRISADNEQPEKIRRLEGIPMTKIQCIVPHADENSYWIGTEDDGLFKMRLSGSAPYREEVTKFGTEFGLENANVQSVLEDEHKNVWVCTFGDGLHKVQWSTLTDQYESAIVFNEENGLSSNYVKCIYQDRERNIWLGTYGGGLSNLSDDFFEFYGDNYTHLGQDLSAIYVDEHHKYFGLPYGLLKVEARGATRFSLYTDTTGFINAKVTAIYKDSKGLMWIGTAHDGLYSHDPKTEIFTHFPLSADQLSNSIRGITSDGHVIWVATSYGVFTLNPSTGNLFQFSIENGLKHNNINTIFQDSKENIWITTSSNYITVINGEKLENYQVTTSGEILDVIAMTEDANHNIWIATSGSGVYRYSGATFTNFSTKNGLRSNYCYSIITDKNGNVWIGHRGGLSRIDPSTGVIQVYDKTSGISSDCNPNAVWEDPLDNIWIGTSEGAIKYNPNKDLKNQVPPNTDITGVQVGEDAVALDSVIRLGYGIYKVKFDFIGVSFNNSERVTYQYKLDGYDLDWSDPTTQSIASYSHVEDGTYTFLVRACNSDGIWNKKPTPIELIIDKPIWKKWWFILSCFAAVVYLIYLYGRMRERRHEAQQLYLQRELDARTSEVQEKNKELRRKNKDITDSINYAKRIQKATMPNPGQLSEILPEAFIFFRPRDIVSGDFYWFSQHGNSLLLACADSTGHGVPGAFMSMIGSTILQDTLHRSDVTSPREVLVALDHEITTMLSRGSDEDARDGMDCSVVQIELDTRKVRIASAMRPHFIYSGGKLDYIKANRSPIGGALFDRKKVFTEQEVQLNPGDCIYLFTDGYPDQFGGVDTKKMKVTGMRAILEEVKDLPMSEQSQVISDRFDEWRRDCSQIDDVLVIGLRL